MAKARICDRCSGFYRKNEKEIMRVEVVDTNGVTMERIDLCDDCATRFQKWLNVFRKEK